MIIPRIKTLQLFDLKIYIRKNLWILALRNNLPLFTRNKKRQIRRTKTRGKAKRKKVAYLSDRIERKFGFTSRNTVESHDFPRDIVEINVVNAFAALLLGWKREFARKQDRTAQRSDRFGFAGEPAINKTNRPRSNITLRRRSAFETCLRELFFWFMEGGVLYRFEAFNLSPWVIMRSLKMIEHPVDKNFYKDILATYTFSFYIL